MIMPIAYFIFMMVSAFLVGWYHGAWLNGERVGRRLLVWIFVLIISSLAFFWSVYENRPSNRKVPSPDAALAA